MKESDIKTNEIAGSGHFIHYKLSFSCLICATCYFFSIQLFSSNSVNFLSHHEESIVFAADFEPEIVPSIASVSNKPRGSFEF